MRLLDRRPLARIVSRRPDGGGQPGNRRLWLRTDAVPIEDRHETAVSPTHVGRVPIEMTHYHRRRALKQPLADRARGSVHPRSRKLVEINWAVVGLRPQVAPARVVPVSPRRRWMKRRGVHWCQPCDIDKLGQGFGEQPR